MKILINGTNGSEKSAFLIGYLRDTTPEIMQDVILIDMQPGKDAIEWGSAQSDFTYIYFEEKINAGEAYDRIITELHINEDLLIMDNCHIPLVGSFERLLSGLRDNPDAFAVGPVSNSFEWDQAASWEDAEDALDWSETVSDNAYNEVLFLFDEVILFKDTAIKEEAPFDKDAKTIKEMIIEKCIREFLGHKRMYVSIGSGFWDVRGKDYKDAFIVDVDYMEQKFGIHYLNVRGNEYIISNIAECLEDKNGEINVLEVGCDCGGTLFAVKKLFKNAHLYGTDICEGSLRFASEFAEVKVNNIEDKNLDFGVKFDIIIFGDVLEHLRDPLGAILYCKTLLKENGRLAASIPNLMNISVMKQLLDGNFSYSEYGLLDKTHIHMFTYNEIINMFVGQAGYSIEKITMNRNQSSDDEKLIEELLKLGNAEKFMYQAFQYQVVARLDR